MRHEEADSQSGAVDNEHVAEANTRSNSTALKKETIVPSVATEVINQPRDATEEEIKTLRHVSDRIPTAAWIVILAGAAERATYFGIIAPWQNYMQNARESNDNPGALGLGQSTATNIFNAFFLFSFLTPMLFALLSDIYIGRYKSLMAGLALYLIGCLLLLLTSLPVALDHGAGLPGLILAMIFIGFGAGCIRATYFPFIGDQYVQKKPQLLRQHNDENVIVDGTRTLQLLYNLYYWFTNVAALSTIATTFLEKEVDFWAAYALCTACLCISIIILVLWARRLVRVEPQGNNLPQAVKVALCAVRSGWKLENAKQSYQMVHSGETVLWSDKFVDELKRGLLACRVILSYVIFYLCVNQMFNNLVSQAGQMNLHGVPNDMIQAFSGVACILIGPLIQHLYNFLASQKIPFRPIARIAVAFMFCGGTMAYATGVQKLIYVTEPCYDQPRACQASENGKLPNDINVWVQIPIYFILAVGEILGFVTASEYAYSKAPQDMKTMVQAFIQVTACAGSALGMALSPVAKDPDVLVMYACLAGVMTLSAALFYWRFRKYDKIDEELNQMDFQEAAEGASRESSRC
ncbi:peptide transporter ptr2 [Lobaria immixta]|nr:peptide transporter ptr2 [Lobaria immixta]